MSANNSIVYDVIGITTIVIIIIIIDAQFCKFGVTCTMINASLAGGSEVLLTELK